MKTIRWLVALLLVLGAGQTHAIPRTFNGTIDTPAVLVWADPNGDIVAPYANDVYLDQSTGLVWRLINTGTSTPQLTLGGTTVGQYYLTTDCTGTIYIAVLQTDPVGTIYAFNNGNGLSCTPSGQPLTITSFQSEWKGTCIASTTPIPSNYNVYVVAMVTTPTLPAGPYHLELR